MTISRRRRFGWCSTRARAFPATARDLDLTESNLRTWVERARADRTHGKTGLTTAEREELTRLRKDDRELKARWSVGREQD
jgi:transposase-like protein